MTATALTVRFLSELCALAALAYGGLRVPAPVWAKVLIAAAFVLVAIVVWGRWVAPKATHPLPDPQRLVPEWLVFGGATVALVVTGYPLLAVGFVVLAAGSRVLLWRFGSDAG